MRRVLTIAFLVALVVLVGAPALVGQAAQARQAALLEGLSGAIARSRAETETYDAGWFGSEARHRLVFDDPAYLALAQDLFDDESLEAPPALVIDSRIAHGPWPGLDAGPALARIRSTLRIEAGPHGLDLPGEALTRIDLGGGGTTVYTADGMIHEAPGGEARLVWNGGRIEVEFDRYLDALDSEAEIGAVAVTGADGELVVGPMTASAETRMSDYGFRTGTSELALERFGANETGGRSVQLTGLRISGRIAVEDGLVSHAYTADGGFAALGPLGAGTLHTQSTLTGLDAASYGRVMKAASRGEEADPADLHGMLAGSPELDLSRFEVDSAEGKLTGHLRLWLVRAAVDSVAAATAGDYLRRLGVEGRIQIGEGLVTAAAARDPQAADAAGALVAMGYLRPAAGGYEMQLAYGGGLLTINGLPVPVPAGALSR